MNKKYLIILPIVIFIFIFWNHGILYPLKLLVVFFHEFSHCLATLLTGGRVEEIVIVKEQGGYAVSVGGNPFITMSAGYLGSILFGAALYMVTAASTKDRLIMSLMGLCICLITLLFVRNLFGFIFCMSTGVVMILSGKYLSHQINDLILRLIALTNMLYVPLDIYSDTIARSYLPSDAQMLAQQFGGSTLIWGTLWIILSLFVIYYCLRWSFKNEAG